MSEFSTPLHLTSPMERSERVKEAQWTLAGHNVFHQDFHPGGLDGEFGPLTAAAVEQAKYLLGCPAKSVDRSYAQLIHDYLTGAKPLPPAYLARRSRSNGGEVAANTRFVKDARFPASYFIRVGT